MQLLCILVLERKRGSLEPMILNGWKEIANHLGRGVRTVQRWESLGLPIRRPNSRLRSAVICNSEDLDSWVAKCASGRPLPAPVGQPDELQQRLATIHLNVVAVNKNALRLLEQIKEIYARAEAGEKQRAEARSA